MSDDRNEPTLVNAIRAVIHDRLADVHVAIPARVESYDAVDQRVSVKPLVKRGFVDETGTRQVEGLPVIPDVPFMFPGNGSFRMTWPVAVGDTVLLMFAEASLDQWLARDGEIDPRDDRRHTLTDAIAIPGLNSFKSAKAASTAALVIETGNEIRLGSQSASDPLALSSELADLKSRISSWSPVANDGGASLKSVVFSPWPVPGATKVKAV